MRQALLILLWHIMLWYETGHTDLLWHIMLLYEFVLDHFH